MGFADPEMAVCWVLVFGDRVGNINEQVLERQAEVLYSWQRVKADVSMQDLEVEAWYFFLKDFRDRPGR